MIRREMLSHLELLEVRSHTMETDLILYDTDKPINDSTGLPPVKAVLKQRAQSVEDKQGIATTAIKEEAQVVETSEDKSVIQEDIAEVVEPKPRWWDSIKQRLSDLIFWVIAILFLWLVYNLIKLFKT